MIKQNDMTDTENIGIKRNNSELGRIEEHTLPKGKDDHSTIVDISEGTSLDSLGAMTLEEEMKQYSTAGLLFTKEIISNLPKTLREIVEVCITEKERSLMLSTLLPTAACAIPNVQGVYGGKKISPNIFSVNLGRFGTGKSLQGFSGNLLAAIVEQLAIEQIEDEKQYEIAVAEYEEAKKTGENCDKPVPPPTKRLIVAGNITKTLLITRIYDNPHGVIIIEVEGDTIVTANKMDSNNYMDLLRASYGNETISVERKGGELSLMLKHPVVCILLSMTYNQIFKLIPNIEDGMYSRIAFSNLPVSDVFEDMFDEARDGYEDSMNEKGKILLHIFNLLRNRSIDKPVIVKLGNMTQRKNVQGNLSKVQVGLYGKSFFRPWRHN